MEAIDEAGRGTREVYMEERSAEVTGASFAESLMRDVPLADDPAWAAEIGVPYAFRALAFDFTVRTA